MDRDEAARAAAAMQGRLLTPPGVACPQCGAVERSTVGRSMPMEGGRERFRKCQCGHSFKTHETVVAAAFRRRVTW